MYWNCVNNMAYKFMAMYHHAATEIHMSPGFYNNLLEEYRRGLALIIPLDPYYDQDKARFSQKIAEYLSTKSAILTNKVGEINCYFKDDEIITCEFNKESFAKTFKWIELHPEECKTTGIKGFERGNKEFCYKIVGKKLYYFLDSIA